jgi:predicted lipoprotein with Yx(FWY)xxD motif
MSRSAPIKFLTGAALIPLAALTVAACGSGGAATAATPAPPKTTSGAPATIGMARTSLGNVLIDSRGRTVYLFKADKGTRSACSGACAAAWPPLRASGKPAVGRGVKPSLVGTTARSDGKPQVTYNGHPLYLYSGDQKPGDVNGQAINAFGAQWFVLTPGGTQISSQPSGGSGSGSGNGGVGGY